MVRGEAEYILLDKAATELRHQNPLHPQITRSAAAELAIAEILCRFNPPTYGARLSPYNSPPSWKNSSIGTTIPSSLARRISSSDVATSGVFSSVANMAATAIFGQSWSLYHTEQYTSKNGAISLPSLWQVYRSTKRLPVQFPLVWTPQQFQRSRP